MSDNLKVAKECGFVFKLTGEKPELVGFEEALEAYTSHILASQQAAHDEEVAELQRENASLSFQLEESREVSCVLQKSNEYKDKLLEAKESDIDQATRLNG